MLLAERTAEEPGIWDKFSDIDTELMIDHMKIRENWVVKVFIAKKDGHVEVTSSAASGWNSRSPQSSAFSAKFSPTEGWFSTGKHRQKYLQAKLSRRKRSTPSDFQTR